MCERYSLDVCEDPIKVLEGIAENRACIKKGGEPDLSKAAALILDEFRSGTIGRITLEKPEEYDA